VAQFELDGSAPTPALADDGEAHEDAPSSVFQIAELLD
jgi:hypothetical protein